MKRKLPDEDYNDSCKRLRQNFGFADLPVEMIVQILRHLSPSERRAINTVSSNWLQIIDKYFPEDNCIYLSENSDFSHDGPLYQTFHTRLHNFSHRAFSHMVIESSPATQQALFHMADFIALVSEETQFLKIISWNFNLTLRNDWINNHLYKMMPKLQTLEVQCEAMLGNRKWLPAQIKITTQKLRIESVNRIRKEPFIKCFTSEFVTIFRGDLSSDLSFMEDNAKELFGKLLNNPSNAVIFETNFNFSGDKKLSSDDVTGLSIITSSFNFAYGQFKNLKRLKIFQKWNFNNEPVHANNEPLVKSGVTHLKICGDFVVKFPNLLHFFPECESLEIDHCELNNVHFMKICGFMPKLKELVLKPDDSKITLAAIFARSNYSLKNLRFLEKFVITTGDDTWLARQYQWPPMPHLKAVSLTGECFESLKTMFYSSMARKSPNITRLTINYLECWEAHPSKFFPLLMRLNLTHLSLPGASSYGSNQKLVNNVIHHCKNLETFYVYDINGLLFQQEIALFDKIPSLQEIISDITEDSDMDEIRLRLMTRNDFENQKQYLRRSLMAYKNIPDFAEYLLENHIPAEERDRMSREFDLLYPNEENEAVKAMYIVTKDYLNFDALEMCSLLCANMEQRG